MTLIRIFYKGKLSVGEKLILNQENNVNYVVNVMKRKIDDKIIFVNGKDGEFIGKIINVTKREITVIVIEKTRDFKTPFGPGAGSHQLSGRALRL